MHGSSTEDIGRKFDELSTEVVLGINAPADPDRWADSLSAVAVLARAPAQAELSAMAAPLAGAMRTAPGSGSEDEICAEFSNSLDTLRAALEDPAITEDAWAATRLC